MDIQKLAKDLLLKYELYEFPVKIVELANKLGFVVLQQNIQDSGFILVDENDPFLIPGKPDKVSKVIVVNNTDSPLRKRFTVAHEIGHYLLYCADKNNNRGLFAHRENNAHYDPNEKIVNDIASEILMPYEILDSYLNHLIPKLDIVSDELLILKIAQDFNVSESAAAVRLDKYYRGK